MFENRRISAILLAAGSGFRFGSEVPKQFHLLDGKEIFRYPLETLAESNFFEEIILVCHPDWTDLVDLPENVKVVPGGKTRQESAYIGLKSFNKGPDIVLIHDSVRPFVSEEILRENILGAIQHAAVDTCIPSRDTIVCAPSGKLIDSIPSRKTFFRGQTPQTFSFPLILEAHNKAIELGIQDATDDCQLALKAGHKVTIVPGSEDNLKITTEFDLKVAEIFLNPLVLPK